MDVRARLRGHIDYYDVSVSIVEVDSYIFTTHVLESIPILQNLCSSNAVFVYGDFYTPSRLQYSRLQYSLSVINTKTDTFLVDKSSSPRFR